MNYRVRLQVEPILRNICRQKGVPPPDVSDEELAELGPRPDRQDLFRFVVRKIRSA